MSGRVSAEGDSEGWVALIVVSVMVVVVAGMSALIAYGKGQQEVRTEWCTSLGGQVSDDLCVKDNRVVLRWDN